MPKVLTLRSDEVIQLDLMEEAVTPPPIRVWFTGKITPWEPRKMSRYHGGRLYNVTSKCSYSCKVETKPSVGPCVIAGPCEDFKDGMKIIRGFVRTQISILYHSWTDQEMEERCEEGRELGYVRKRLPREVKPTLEVNGETVEIFTNG